MPGLAVASLVVRTRNAQLGFIKSDYHPINSMGWGGSRDDEPYCHITARKRMSNLNGLVAVS